jgi:hypothetical protein
MVSEESIPGRVEPTLEDGLFEESNSGRLRGYILGPIAEDDR